MDHGHDATQANTSNENVNREMGMEEDEPSKKRRGPSRGLKARKTKQKDLLWTTYFTPYGKSRSEFKSFLGSLAKSHCNINHKWLEVSQVSKDSMWQEVMDVYKLPNDKILKKKVLAFISVLFRNFKGKLVLNFIVKERQDGKKPYEVYDGMISQQDWTKFYADRTTPEALEDAEKHRQSQSVNIYPHYLGPLGYEGIKPKWRDEGLLTKTLEDGTVYTPSLSEPIDRADSWVFARTKTDARGYSHIPCDSTQQVAESILGLRQEVAEGLWTPHRHDDVLTRALGKKEHPGRVRGFGGEVRIRDVFGPPGSRSSQSKGISAEDVSKMLNEFEERINRQGIERMEKLFEEKYGFHPSQPPIPVPSSPHTILPSIVGSDDPYPFKGVKDMTRCRMALNCDGTQDVIVAEGLLMRSSSDVLVHHKQLRRYHAKVNVDIVLNGYNETPIPVPDDECNTLQEAVGHFIQWPSRLIYINDQMPSSGSKGLSNRAAESIMRESLVDETSLNSMAPKCKRLHDRIIEMPPDIDGLKIDCDKSVFGYEEDFELTVTFTDVTQMMTSELLEISIIQAFMMCLRAKMNDAGISSIVFLCPKKCCLDEVHKSPKKFKDYLLSMLIGAKDTRFFFIPYIQSKHWMLLVISLPDHKLLVFDPAGKGRTKIQIKNDIDVCFQNYRYKVKKTKVAFSLKNVNCPTQPGVTECGYYVMRYIYEIVTQHHESSNLLQASKTSLAYDDKEIKMLLDELAEYIEDHATFV